MNNIIYKVYIMIRQFIKPTYSHAPWKNPKYPPSCMCKGKPSPAKVLGGKVSTANKAVKGETMVAPSVAATSMNSYQQHRYELQRHRASKTAPVTVPTIVSGWNMFPLIEGFTTFWRILKKS